MWLFSFQALLARPSRDGFWSEVQSNYLIPTTSDFVYHVRAFSLEGRKAHSYITL